MARTDTEVVRKGVTEQKVVTIDYMGTGDYETISEAIEAVEPSTKIMVLRGTYYENLRIDKPGITIEGEPGVKLVVSDGDAVVFNSNIGYLRNIEITRGCMDGIKDHGVNIKRGIITIESCVISDCFDAAIAVHSGASAYVHKCNLRRPCGVLQSLAYPLPRCSSSSTTK